MVVALRDRAVVLVERIDLPGPAARRGGGAGAGPAPAARAVPRRSCSSATRRARAASRPALDALRGQLTGPAWTCSTGWWCATAGGSPSTATGVLPRRRRRPSRRPPTPLPSPSSSGSGRTAARSRGARRPGRRRPARARRRWRRPWRHGPTAGPSRCGRRPRRFEALSAWAVVLRPQRWRRPTRSTAVDALRPDQVALLVDSLRRRSSCATAWWRGCARARCPLDCLSPDVRRRRAHLPADARAERAAGGARSASDEPTARAAIAGRGGTWSRGSRRWSGSVPDEHAAAPLTVLANLAWWLGDGALARTCLDRALRPHPATGWPCCSSGCSTSASARAAARPGRRRARRVRPGRPGEPAAEPVAGPGPACR